MATIQTTTEGFIANATEIVEAAGTAIEDASTAGVSEENLAEATELYEHAESLVHYVEADGSGGLHNSEKTFTLVNYAAQLAGEAQAAALEAKAEAASEEVETLESEKAALESEKASLSSEVSSLETRVSGLESEVSDLEQKAASGSTNMIIGAVAGLIIGAVAVFFIKK